MTQVTTRLLVVLLAQHQYGVDLHHIHRVVHAVLPTHLPDAPPAILGAINHHGNILPVLSLRRRFALPDKPIALSDYLVLVESQGRSIALLVDHVLGIIQRPASELASLDKTAIPTHAVPAALQTSDGLLLVYDLAASLTPQETQQLDLAIARHPNV